MPKYKLYSGLNPDPDEVGYFSTAYCDNLHEAEELAFNLAVDLFESDPECPTWDDIYEQLQAEYWPEPIDDNEELIYENYWDMVNRYICFYAEEVEED
jgi:hypothetical protein